MNRDFECQDVSGFGGMLFKYENVADLLMQIDERVDLMEKAYDGFKGIEGINLIELWKNLYAEFKKLWIENPNWPVIKLSKLQFLKLTVISDMVAVFFLYNGNDTDTEFLKNVDGLFKDINESYKVMSTEERWSMLKQMLKQAK